MSTIITSGVVYAQFLEDLRAVVRYEVSQHLSVASTAADSDELLTIQEAAALLDVCPQTVHEWKRRGLLPYHKLSGRTYLKKADVLASLRGEQRSQKAGRHAKATSCSNLAPAISRSSRK